jgi:hypothetical protein
MTTLILSSLMCPALIAIALSVWIRPEVTLGKSFWILTIFIAALPFVLFAIWLAMPKDPYGYSTFGLVPVAFLGLVAIGWLLGVVVVLIARTIRGKNRVTLRS